MSTMRKRHIIFNICINPLPTQLSESRKVYILKDLIRTGSELWNFNGTLFCMFFYKTIRIIRRLDETFHRQNEG